MALFGNTKMVFCLFFIACCYLTVTVAEVPVDCCLSVMNQKVPKGVIVDYRRQVAGQGCARSATILVTRRQLHLCVPAEEQWVEDIVKHVKQLRKCCSNQTKCKMPKKGPSNLCTGVKPE